MRVVSLKRVEEVLRPAMMLQAAGVDMNKRQVWGVVCQAFGQIRPVSNIRIKQPYPVVPRQRRRRTLVLDAWGDAKMLTKERPFIERHVVQPTMVL